MILRACSLPGSAGATFWSYDDWWDCARAIRDDLRRGDPVIVTWTYATFSGHYINVVGVSVDENDLPEEFIVMETNNYLCRLNWRDMRALMKREFLSYALQERNFDDYHLVRFYR